jgi:RNA polymerase sigma factor (sigma-70 family)
MSERQDLEALLVDNLAWIERVVSSLCRKTGLRGDEADEFSSWVKVKLIDDDYAVFRKFRGESAITTYLTVVLSMLFREYRVSMWGRWRPSAAAQRHGPVAVRLETLVHRDGYTLDQAAEILRAGSETDLSTRALAELLAEFPRREPLRPVEIGAEALNRYAGGADSDGIVVRDELERERRRAIEALRAAVDELAPEDALILRMRYWEGLSVADISRALDLPQKPMYRRISAALARLRGKLEANGLSSDFVAGVLAEPLPGLESHRENQTASPSTW